MTMPSQPASSACKASVEDWMPLTTRLPFQLLRRKDKSVQVRLVPEKALWSQAREAVVSSSGDGVDLLAVEELGRYFFWKTGSDRPIWQPVPL